MTVPYDGPRFTVPIGAVNGPDGVSYNPPDRTEVSYNIGSGAPPAAQARLINDAADRLLNPQRIRREAIKSILRVQAMALRWQVEHGKPVDVQAAVAGVLNALNVLGGVTAAEFIDVSNEMYREDQDAR